MQKKALLIGINKYDFQGEVKYARQDAESFAEVLCHYCGFTQHDITIMSCKGERGKKGNSKYIERALENLKNFTGLELLIFGFWGHGFAPRPGVRYLCGIDTATDDLERTAISMELVQSRLTQVQAENTLIVLDCCQNAPLGRSVESRPMSEGEEANLADMARDIQAVHRSHQKQVIPTVAVLNSCSEGQCAYEWDERGHGVFTAHLLDAFKEGLGSVAGISSQIVDRVSMTAEEIYHQKQTPYTKIEGKGDIPLVVDYEAKKQEKKIQEKPKYLNEKTTLSYLLRKVSCHTKTIIRILIPSIFVLSAGLWVIRIARKPVLEISEIPPETHIRPKIEQIESAEVPQKERIVEEPQQLETAKRPGPEPPFSRMLSPEESKIDEFRALINRVVPATDRPNVALIIDARRTENGLAPETLLYNNLLMSDRINIVLNLFQEGQFKSKGFFREIYGGNTKLLKEADALSQIDFLLLGELNYSFRSQTGLHSDLVASDINFSYKIINNKAEVVKSDTLRVVGPGFSHDAALERGLEILSETHGERILKQTL
jgi:hypothetical protein